MVQLIAALSVATLVSAHSWVACTNYQTQTTDHNLFGAFKREQCHGYPRSYQNQFREEKSRFWGVDTGGEWRLPTCKTKYNPSDYSKEMPMAEYKSEQTIHISHPAKNHVADRCTNEFIPSTKLTLDISKDSTDDFTMKATMIGNDHVKGKIDYAGYQNCYKFCDDMENSHCLTSWKLPKLPKGRYSARWYWEFNPGEIYTSCFDFMITDGSNVAPTNSPVPTTSVPQKTKSIREEIIDVLHEVRLVIKNN